MTQAPQQNLNSKIAPQNNGFPPYQTNQYPYSYQQPQIIMMPYAPPTQNQSMPNDGFRLLEKMV